MIQKDKVKLELHELILEYDSSLLNRWRNRDINIVPAHLLDHKGPRIENGYGFGEWYVENYYRQRGYEVIHDYNIISKTSFLKHQSLNKTMIP